MPYALSCLCGSTFPDDFDGRRANTNAQTTRRGEAQPLTQGDRTELVLVGGLSWGSQYSPSLALSPPFSVF